MDYWEYWEYRLGVQTGSTFSTGTTGLEYRLGVLAVLTSSTVRVSHYSLYWEYQLPVLGIQTGSTGSTDWEYRLRVPAGSTGSTGWEYCEYSRMGHAGLGGGGGLTDPNKPAVFSGLSLGGTLLSSCG